MTKTEDKISATPGATRRDFLRSLVGTADTTAVVVSPARSAEAATVPISAVLSSVGLSEEPLDPLERMRDAPLCPKGQGGVQVLYDPYRLRKVLKRAGKRGQNKWEAIDFNQAVDEIINGGNLFGEGEVSGLKDIYRLTDPELSSELKGDAAAVVDPRLSKTGAKAW